MCFLACKMEKFTYEMDNSYNNNNNNNNNNNYFYCANLHVDMIECTLQIIITNNNNYC